MTDKCCRIAALAAISLLGAACAQAQVLEDFTFDDADDTLLADAANSASPGNNWTEDAADMSGSAVSGGVYHIQKDNDEFGTNFLDIDNITSGRVWLVAEVAGWSFSSIEGPGEFDSGELEEVRFDLLDNDGTSGSTITAELGILRTDTGGIVLQGNALGDGTQTTAVDMPLDQTDPITMVLQLDKTANTYGLFTSVAGGPFLAMGSGDVDPTRNGNSIRFVVNNNFSGTGEFFDVDRIYLTNVNPIPEPASLAALLIASGFAGALWGRQR